MRATSDNATCKTTKAERAELEAVGPGALFEIARQVGSRGAQGGDQAEHDAHRQRYRQGVSQDAEIQVEMNGREREQGRTHGPQDVARPPREQQAGGTGSLASCNRGFCSFLVK
jgi:hypothetical protein